MNLIDLRFYPIDSFAARMRKAIQGLAARLKARLAVRPRFPHIAGHLADEPGPDVVEWKGGLLEWAAIIIPIWLYCQPFLDMNTLVNLPGMETEFFQSFDQILEFSLKKYGQFPLWNPYYTTGIPFIAHPMLHAYNPAVTLPVLLFGYLNGFKIAIALGFVIAGLGMWWLGRELGMGPVARTWIGLMYAFSGVAAAKFLQGQYLMVLAFGWLPLGLAAVMAAMRTRRPRQIAVAALALALIFFCGNVYYAYYMLYVLAIFALVMLFGFRGTPGRPAIDIGGLKVLLSIGVLALGLISIQLLPTVEYRNQYLKDTNTALTDSQSLGDVFMDFVAPNPFRPGAFTNAFRPEEYYAYVGWWPLLGMLFLPLAWNKRNRRQILFLLALVVFVFLWIDVKDMPWKSAFQNVPLLAQFRYPSRMVVIGAMALIVLGGLGLDRLWKLAKAWVQSAPLDTFGGSLRLLCAVSIGFFLVWSTGDLWQTTRALVWPWTNDVSRANTMQWVRDYDPGIYYVDAPSGWDQIVLGNQLRYRNGEPALLFMPSGADSITNRAIEVNGKYLITQPDNPVDPGDVLLKSLPGANIYKEPDSLPFAFTIDKARLAGQDNSGITVAEVTGQTISDADINALTATLKGDENHMLIVLSVFSPNWRLTIDNRPAPIDNVGGFMATNLVNGRHVYKFSYQPVSFFAGLAISAATLLLLARLLLANKWKVIPGESGAEMEKSLIQ